MAKGEKIPVGPKDAVQIAANYYRAISNDMAARITAEEIEMGNNKWLITLGISSGITPFSGLIKYKSFSIDAETGNVISMKMKHIK